MVRVISATRKAYYYCFFLFVGVCYKLKLGKEATFFVVTWKDLAATRFLCLVTAGLSSNTLDMSRFKNYLEICVRKQIE